jgi:SAM-dependent MidA family methyltransferase
MGAILAGRRHTASVRTDAADTIRATIRHDGPITFATFMELALYGPGGYYDAPPVGPDGDFVTSPHVHPAFGMFVARALDPLRDVLGTDPLRVTEVGAGDGTLARQILGAMHDVTYTGVEVSAGARAALAEISGVQVATVIDRPVDVVLAHELLDNLPFRLIRAGEEIRIDVEGDAFIERPTAMNEGLRDLAGASSADEIVVPTGALALIERFATVLERGYVLLIDYGEEDGGSPVHGYRAHRPIADVLAQPGAVDITAGVDFGRIARQAEMLGLRAFPLQRQSDVLLALGFEKWLYEELAVQQEQLAAGLGLEAVRTWSARSRATMLVDPTSLGRMRWLLLATDDLPAPSWLHAGQEANDPSTDRRAPAGEMAVAPAMESRGHGDVRMFHFQTASSGDVAIRNVWYRSSTDGCATWTAPVKISDASGGGAYQVTGGFPDPPPT